MVAQYGRLHLILVIWSHLLFTLALISCLPNIRIQVNNENFQSPPYLLEALKQVEASQTNSSLRIDSNRVGAHKQIPNSSQNPTLTSEQVTNPAKSVSKYKTNEEEVNFEDTELPQNFSLVKEETVEELLDLDPESVFKLSVEGILNGVSPADFSQISDVVASDTTNGQEYASLNEGNSNKNSELLVEKHHNLYRKPHLPVTSSHIKKPIGGLLAGEDSLTQEEHSQVVVNETKVQKSNEFKSLVSPTVAVDEIPVMNLIKKNVPTLPDTLEPNQIMNGVTNASLVPATVNKDYGHQTRTRVTLGGGYVRNKLPPSVSPSSSSFRDDRPEKLVVPLEKSSHLTPMSSLTEVSRVIEVPERIVLPVSALLLDAKQKQQDNNNKLNITTQVLGKPDSRCPKKGSMTIEHPAACDKYFYCEDGYISEQTCPNGLMYGTREMVKDYCVHRWKAACEDKSIPNPISSPGCRWQYGIFSVQGSPKCSPDFYECFAGKFEVKKCSIDGQVYDDRTKSCQFAEKVGCANEALADFRCPPDDQGNTYWPFPRYFLNERALIHCVNDKPEIVRCTDEERVDPEHLHCVPLAKLTQANSSDGSSVERRARERKKSSQ